MLYIYTHTSYSRSNTCHKHVLVFLFFMRFIVHNNSQYTAYNILYMDDYALRFECLI